MAVNPETTDLPPLRTLAHRLVALSRRLAEGAHVDAPGAALAMDMAMMVIIGQSCRNVMKPTKR